MLNVVALMGRLVADPELRHTPNGVATCTFRIAVDRSFVRAGEERKADFIDIVVWRQTAEFVCKYFHKGNLIAVDDNAIMVYINRLRSKIEDNARTPQHIITIRGVGYRFVP